jgi:mRNA turnover protein 4
MPISKRNKVVALTQVKKKGKEHKEDVVEGIREALNNYSDIYVLSYHNMTTNPFKKIREDFKESKFFLGKNKLAQFALGKTQEDEPMEHTSLLTKYITGECCLLFTN